MIVNRRTSDSIRSKLNDALRVSTLSTSSGIGFELVETITAVSDKDYISIYDISRNTRLDTCDNEYLDHYGKMLDEPRQSRTYAYSDDLVTTYLYIVDINGNRVRGDLVSSDGAGLEIPKGAVLLDRNKKPILKTTNTVRLSSETVYVKTIALSSGSVVFPPGSVTGIQFDISLLPNVDKSAAVSYSLVAENIKTISGGNQDADENTYRYILQEKSKSINLSNIHKLNTIMDFLGVRRFVVDKINKSTTSMVVYLETKNIETDSLLVESVQAEINNIFPFATDIRVRTFVYSNLSTDISLTTSDTIDRENAVVAFKDKFVTAVADTYGGTQFNIESIISGIINGSSEYLSANMISARINMRKLNNSIYPTRKIEKVFAYPDMINIV